MRNLKRALSLTLASVMLLGMMVIGTSAASFNDADDISNVTAATILQELDIMVGADGNFMPEAPVSRAQMAKLVCLILYGSKLNVSQFEGTTQYTDVPVYEWYTGYINLATQLGIIGGYGDGRFGPDDTVTTAQAALMLSRTLGYYQAGEDQGDWASVSLKAIAQATKLKMFGDLKLSTNALLSRDNVAEMVFRTMTESVPVQYSEFFKTYYTDERSPMNGVIYSWTNTLGYRNYNLIYAATDGDDFGRPSTMWGTGTIDADNLNGDGKIDTAAPAKNPTIASNKQIIEVADNARYTFTGGLKLKDMYDTLGRSVYNDLTANTPSDFEVLVDGAPVAGADVDDYMDRTDSKTSVPGTGRGVLTQIYVNDDNDVTISMINTYVLQVDGEYDDRKGELQLKELDGTLALPGDTSAKLSDKDFDGLKAYSDKDYVLVTVANEEIKTITKADLVTETVTAYVAKKGDATSNSVTAGSTYKYNASYTAADKTYVIGEDYVLVLDNYGNVIFADGVEVDGQYVYITETKETGGVGADLQAMAYFVDGTSEKIIVDTKNSDDVDAEGDGEHTWFTYTKKSGGKYELKALKAEDSAGGGSSRETSEEIADTNRATVIYEDGTFRANNKTAFIVLRDGTVYTYQGIREVPKLTGGGEGSYVNAVMDGSFAKYVFIEAPKKTDLTINGTANKYFYIYDEEPVKSNNSDGDPVYTYSVIMDGKLTTIVTNDGSYALGLYNDVKTDSKGNVDEAAQIVDTADENLKAYALTNTKLNIKGDVLSVGSTDLVMKKDGCDIWVSDGDKTGTTTESRFVRDYSEGFTGILYLVVDKDGIVQEIYVEEMEEDDDAFDGFTADPETAVNPQPGSKDEVADDISKTDNGANFAGAEGIVSTGLKQSVSTENNTTTIKITGTVTPVDLNSAADLKALAVWNNADPEADYTKDQAQALVKALNGNTEYNGQFALISVNINGNVKLLIVKDDNGSAKRFGTSPQPSATKWDNANSSHICPTGYEIDISGLKFPAGD